MRETFFLKGSKYTVNHPLEDGLALVRAVYPNAYAEGSTCHYSYIVNLYKENEETVAEAWCNRNATIWYIRMKAIK